MNRKLTYLSVALSCMFMICSALFLFHRATPTFCQPQEGDYLFGENIKISVDENHDIVAYRHADGSTRKPLHVKVAFFDYTDAGFQDSGDYLISHPTCRYQQNGIAVSQSDTTQRYWVALSGNREIGNRRN